MNITTTKFLILKPSPLSILILLAPKNSHQDPVLKPLASLIIQKNNFDPLKFVSLNIFSLV